MISVLTLLVVVASATAQLAKTPPMGWMSWEIFRCNIDCASDPNNCINDYLYKSTTDALVAGGFLAAGYDTVHIDDCWEQTKPPRDPATKQLVPDPNRFPLGMADLGNYMHQRGVKFALYTAESDTTCGGYPASKGYESIDAATFASWGVDYLKVDGCGDDSYYSRGYKLMGDALINQSRPIVYSCSWPAYLGSDETTKPFAEMIADHCNLWRNWDDIQCSYSSLNSIISHWGQYTTVLKRWAGPGHWNDPDMLLIGNDCITDDEARTQMAIWSIVAAPLIMGNDVRNVSNSTKAILLNPDAIAVDQDPMGEQGLRLVNTTEHEIWARNLSDGRVAVALYNKASNCGQWNVSVDGYQKPCAGGLRCVPNVTFDHALEQCCASLTCAGVAYNNAHGEACFQTDAACGFEYHSQYNSFYKPAFVPGQPYANTTLTINFALVGLSGTVQVYDIWQRAVVATTTRYYSTGVPSHGSAFLILKKVSPELISE